MISVYCSYNDSVVDEVVYLKVHTLRKVMEIWTVRSSFRSVKFIFSISPWAMSRFSMKGGHLAGEFPPCFFAF